MKLTIDNFQSISHAEIDFPIGITTITGPNSSGKSAVLRSLEFFTRNKGKPVHIKEKEKAFNITLNVDGDIYSWNRKKTSATFSKNNEEFEKIGVKTPHEYFPNFPLQLDDKGGVLQMSGEWDKLFPFDRSESELFTLFEHVFNISDSSLVLGQIKDEIKTAKVLGEENLKKYNEYADKANTLEAVDASGHLIKLGKMKEAVSLAYQKIPANEDVENARKFEIIAELKLPAKRKFEIDPSVVSTLKADVALAEAIYGTLANIKEVSSIKKEITLVDIAEIHRDTSWAREAMTELENLTNAASLKKDIDVACVADAMSLGKDCIAAQKYLADVEALSGLKRKEFDLSLVSADMEESVIVLVPNIMSNFNEAVAQIGHLTEEKDSILSKLSEVKACPLCGTQL